MRTAYITLEGQTSGAMIRYPDEVCFAFNPNYIEFDINWAYETIVVFDVVAACAGSSYTPTITASLYAGRGKVYLSGLFQLLFDDVKHKRMIDVTVSGHINSSELAWFSFTTKVVWGNIEFGERFGSLGVFKHDSVKPYFERTLVWFKNFPFKVTMLRMNDEEMQGRYDGSTYSPIVGVLHKSFTSIVTLDDGTVVSDTTVDSQSCEIVFDQTSRRFLCVEDGEYFSSWTASGDFGSSEDYNDSEGIAMTDTEWRKGDELYVFDGKEGVLLKVPNYAEKTDGMFELTPALLFPDAVSRATIKLIGDGKGTSVFDNTFDFTFFTSGENDIITRLLVSHKTCGYYLRWIDRFGFYQFYLFAKGDVTTKNKLSSDTIEDMGDYSMYFNNWQRSTQVTAEKKVKCCAENMQESVYAYVETVLTSPISDLYMGKTKGGREMWMPVQIVAGTAKKTPHKPLLDLEIEIQLPTIEPQSL